MPAVPVGLITVQVNDETADVEGVPLEGTRLKGASPWPDAAHRLVLSAGRPEVLGATGQMRNYAQKGEPSLERRRPARIAPEEPLREMLGCYEEVKGSVSVVWVATDAFVVSFEFPKQIDRGLQVGREAFEHVGVDCATSLAWSSSCDHSTPRYWMHGGPRSASVRRIT